MKYYNFVKYLAIAAVTVGTSVPTLMAAEKEVDGFCLISKTQKPKGWLADYIPVMLKHSELQALKTAGHEIPVTRKISNQDRTVFLMSFGNALDGTTIASHMPSSLRIGTNWWRQDQEAAFLVEVFPIDGEDPSKFFGRYELSNISGLSFMLEGRVPVLENKIVRITNLDEEALDEEALDKEAKDESSLPLTLMGPLVPQLQLQFDDLQYLLQQPLMLAALDGIDIKNPLPQGSSELQEALAHGGKHVFSFFAKPLVKKIPVVNVLHPQVEAFAKTLGYSTVTHMVADLMQNGRLNSKLLEVEQSSAIVPSELKSQRLHATSRSLGYAASYLPGGTLVRTVLTMHLNRQGYATITHWAMGVKDLDQAEIKDLYTAPRLAQEGVALAIETFIPLGNVIVAVSQTGARIFLKEPSLTAYAVKKIGYPASQDKIH